MAFLQQTYHKPLRFISIKLWLWDFFALTLIFSLFSLLALGAKQMSVPFHLGESIPISLQLSALPAYALQSVLRMLIAMIFSLLFTFIVASLAAKNKHAERFIIPLIDILQSVPVLGFLSITIVMFVSLFPNNLLGPASASIFAVFTAQVWNMTLGFYQTLKTVPQDLQEASAMFHLSPWQKFWRIEVPLAMPSLTWNAMMSMSASWVFLVASEAISVANQNITLPGIGSYIGLAIKESNIQAIFYSIITMIIIILIYDQCLFRPIVIWSQKFRFEQNPREEVKLSWLAAWLDRAYLMRYAHYGLSKIRDFFMLLPFFNKLRFSYIGKYKQLNKSLTWGWYSVLILGIAIATIMLVNFIFTAIALQEIGQTFKLGCLTLIRVLVSIFISSIIWVPLGVWIGQRPRYARLIQPIIQFLSGFPANVLFPLVVISFIYFKLNPEIWLTLLMVLGSQWYIAFNVIAGTTTLPREYYEVVGTLGVRGWLVWKRFILPGIFPYYITGALTAAGGAWNLSIVTEIVQWGDKILKAHGLGAYISESTASGDFHRIALSIAMMCLFVVSFNRLIWSPLYQYALKKYSL